MKIDIDRDQLIDDCVEYLNETRGVICNLKDWSELGKGRTSACNNALVGIIELQILLLKLKNAK